MGINLLAGRPDDFKKNLFDTDHHRVYSLLTIPHGSTVCATLSTLITLAHPALLSNSIWCIRFDPRLPRRGGKGW